MTDDTLERGHTCPHCNSEEAKITSAKREELATALGKAIEGPISDIAIGHPIGVIVLVGEAHGLSVIATKSCAQPIAILEDALRRMKGRS
jgi:transcription elongation factor Elf1